MPLSYAALPPVAALPCWKERERSSELERRLAVAEKALADVEAVLTAKGEGAGTVHYVPCDLQSFVSVRKAAAAVAELVKENDKLMADYVKDSMRLPEDPAMGQDGMGH